MLVRSFIDTNILIYADDRRDPAKQGRAIDLVSMLMREWRGVISHQVLQEFVSAATQKLGLSPDITRRRVEFFSRFEVVNPSHRITLNAIERQRADRMAFWDALIVETALVAGCAVLYTEDLQPGRRFDGLQVINPFRD